MTNTTNDRRVARELSPRRNTTTATGVDALVDEQLRHFAIDPGTEYGRRLAAVAASLYSANVAAHELGQLGLRELAGLDPRVNGGQRGPPIGPRGHQCSVISGSGNRKPSFTYRLKTRTLSEEMLVETPSTP